MKNVLLLFLLVFSLSLHAQYKVNLPANHWVDSVFKTLTDTQKIAQLMVVRLSVHRPANRKNYLLRPAGGSGYPSV